MSIKDELKAKYTPQPEEIKALQVKARKMIEEFIIPKFRQIAEQKRELKHLCISFSLGDGYFYCMSDIDGLGDSRYDLNVVAEAVKLAPLFDIESAHQDKGCSRQFLCFTLNIE